MREACGEAHMKTILATGECGTMVNVYKASMVCMMAGTVRLLSYIEALSVTTQVVYLCTYVPVYLCTCVPGV